MQTEASHAKTPSIFRSIIDWWRLRHQLDDYDSAELARIAQDLGLAQGELRALAAHRPDDADLLRRRMARLQLDSAQLARTEPATVRDLQRACTLCGSHARCARDLADESADPGWEDWRDYCPNATTLTALSAVQAASAAPRGL